LNKRKPLIGYTMSTKSMLYKDLRDEGDYYPVRKTGVRPCQKNSSGIQYQGTEVRGSILRN